MTFKRPRIMRWQGCCHQSLYHTAFTCKDEFHTLMTTSIKLPFSVMRTMRQNIVFVLWGLMSLNRTQCFLHSLRMSSDVLYEHWTRHRITNLKNRLNRGSNFSTMAQFDKIAAGWCQIWNVWDGMRVLMYSRCFRQGRIYNGAKEAIAPGPQTKEFLYIYFFIFILFLF